MTSNTPPIERGEQHINDVMNQIYDLDVTPGFHDQYSRCKALVDGHALGAKVPDRVVV